MQIGQSYWLWRFEDTVGMMSQLILASAKKAQTPVSSSIVNSFLLLIEEHLDHL
ncbi:hypothetical protein SAMD00019534_094460 [Acytostelium subglobosum LB1]|uniref:hypothetical protein n=1 Tax=Acytostelium subglobosum LB1 TaxID=1410327 RepID=UPI000644F392|nr:hypothetical protein SAMD00019534_094460 [Acytostelium subglobosum LB1]GAM26271.1 hypothetical protein SAMD00019534_094460 [Acytostelium subglobosum LB1]|eukprot:XP_012750825.1 hypothetical protein SAMD00019534_094460 [Acytostelium subglobosum LB1]